MRSRNSLIISVYFGSDREIDDTGLTNCWFSHTNRAPMTRSPDYEFPFIDF